MIFTGARMSNMLKNLDRFIRERGPRLALIVLVMYLISVTQGVIIYSSFVGDLSRRLSWGTHAFAVFQTVLRIGLLLLMLTLWARNWKRALFRLIIVANSYYTVTLLIETSYLVQLLSGTSANTISTIIGDTVLLAVSNILVFSIWYWIIDPPNVIEGEPDIPWAFLFPQRAGSLPHYEAWLPRYGDYLFIAFTTSTAFSPTDTPPLTQTAKLLTLLQATISIITMVGILGGGINILVGGSSSP